MAKILQGSHKKPSRHKYTHLFDENPSVLHNSLNPRPELLAGMNDDLPVKVFHYIWGHGLEGGQGDIRAFIDLKTHHMK